MQCREVCYRVQRMNPIGTASSSHRQVWLLAGPIILSNISTPLVGAVDTAVVGHLPDPSSIGAVALGALIFSFIYWSFGFLRMGTTGFIARAVGAGDPRAFSETLLRVILLASVFGVVTILLGYPIIALALYLVDGSLRVEALAADYAGIRIWSAPATLCVYVFTGIFIGMHNTRRVFALQLLLNLTNVFLDLVFVIGFGLGVEGVAWATLIAEYLAAIAGFYLLRGPIRDALQSCTPDRLLDRSAMVALMRANGDIFIRTLCLTFCFAWFTAEGAGFGEVILAANAILMHFQSFAAYGLDGFAHAAEAMAGSAYGARDRAAFKRTVRATTFWGLLTAIFISLVYLFFGSGLINLFSDLETVRSTAQVYLPWVVALPLVSIWSFQLDGIFIGTGHSREMRNAMIVTTAAYLAAMSQLAPWLGNHGLYLGLYVLMLLRALTLLYYYPAITSMMSESRV